jgi:hypothetical protein
VRQFQRLGTVEAPWGHLHFAERSQKSYRNPLRAGAITPWVDSSSPRIVGITFSRAGKTVTPENVKGDIDVIVQAYDRPPLPVPPPWADMPVTPACLRWRVLGGGKVVRPWHTPVDFRTRGLPQELFSVIFAPGTKQNHPNEPGTYRFFLAHGWTTSLLPNGPYRLEVEASDVSGNRARAGLPFTIAN